MISIDWSNKVINIPQSYLSLVTGIIYELDINAFRLDLKRLEEEEGIPFLDTHRHNTTVILGGITYARTIEIINGYTITFENGFYAVRLTGANSNIEDVTNVNNVSIRSSNSAGLVQVSSGSGLSSQQATQSTELHQIRGLKGGVPVNVEKENNVVTETSSGIILTHTINEEDESVSISRS